MDEARQKDIFLIFVQGIPGHEAEYASWFCGTHRDDMLRMPEISSAHMFRIESRDGQPEPAELCAAYETDDGIALLKAIGSLKGTDQLPDSDIQGDMSWRLFNCTAGSGGMMPDGAPALLWLFPESVPHGIMARTKAEAPYWDVASLSPAQSKRGREFGHALFAGLGQSTDPHSGTAERPADLPDGARCLLLKPAIS